jgi:hypothetical protein
MHIRGARRGSHLIPSRSIQGWCRRASPRTSFTPPPPFANKRAAAGCRGGPQFGWDKTPLGTKAWASAAVAGGATLAAVAVGIPLLMRKVERDMAEGTAAATAMAT